MPFESLHQGKRGPGRPPKPKAATLQTGLELLARGLFAIPGVLGQGDHWYLDEKESAQIADQANAALTSLPVKQVEKLTKIVNVWAPWIGLTVTLAVCLIARIQYTRTLYASRAPGVRSPDRPTDSPAAYRSDVPGNGAAPGAGAAKNRVADFLRESEGPGPESGPQHPA